MRPEWKTSVVILDPASFFLSVVGGRDQREGHAFDSPDGLGEQVQALAELIVADREWRMSLTT